MADLTDAQWVDEVIAVVAGLLDGSLTPAQADARLTTATENWPTRTISNARVYEELVSFLARLNGLILTNGPPSSSMGELNTFAYDTANGALYGPKTASGWGTPVSLVGPPGPAIELQKSATHVQYRTIGAATWINLVALSDLKGADGQNISLQTTATHIQWRLGTGTWTNLAALSALKGADGQEVSLRRTGDLLQWRLGGGAWVDLADLTAYRGPVGPAPNVSVAIQMIAHGEPAVVTRSGSDVAPLLTFSLPSPLDGADGRQVEFNVSATHIQTRYVGDAVWVDLIALASLKGVKGDKGDAFTVNATGNGLSARAAYDGEPAGFSFVDTATGLIYFRQGASGWSDGIPFGQAQNDILDALALLDAAPGVLVQTGDATFEKRAVGVSAGSSIPDRDAADTRYRRISQGVPLADVTGLAAALNDKADAAAVVAALGGKQDALGFAPENASKKGQANGYAGLGSDGKVPSAQLPAAPTVPVKATGAALRAATNDTDFVTPKSVADAAALVALTDVATIAVDLAAGTNFTITLAGNRTLGAPSGAKPGMSGTILIKQDATGSRTLAYNTAWKPFGSTPSLSTAASAVDLLTWIVEDAGKVRFTLAKGGAA